jgi:hypothetical protein
LSKLVYHCLNFSQPIVGPRITIGNRRVSTRVLFSVKVSAGLAFGRRISQCQILREFRVCQAHFLKEIGYAGVLAITGGSWNDTLYKYVAGNLLMDSLKREEPLPGLRANPFGSNPERIECL